jgi:cytochrome c oxidase subunit 1
VKESPDKLDTAYTDEELGVVLAETWYERPGLWGWLTTTDHKRVATRTVVTALVFFVLAGLEALVMRMQLARPENTLLGPDRYDQFFTMHGTTMMFLFAVPIMEGIAIYLVPLMIGARNVAFPRLNLYGYYTYLIGGILVYVAFIWNWAPTLGGSSTSRFRGRSSIRASAPTSGRRWSPSPRSRPSSSRS